MVTRFVGRIPRAVIPQADVIEIGDANGIFHDACGFIENSVREGVARYA